MRTGAQQTEPRIARIFGVDVRLHWSFLILVAFLLVDGFRLGGRGIFDATVWMVMLFGSVLVHELAHAVVGRARGAAVKDIVLLPIGGATRTERFPDRPRDEFLMTIVGPASSFALAGLAGLAVVLSGRGLLPVDLHHGSLAARLFWLNILLGGFNLLPAFPMDGGRILRAGLTTAFGKPRATQIAATVGKAFAIGFGILGIYTNLWFLIIAVFIFMAAGGEAQEVQMTAAVEGRRVEEAMLRPAPVVSGGTTLRQAVSEALASGLDALIVQTPARLGVAALPDLVAAEAADPGAPVESAARFDVPTVAPQASLSNAVESLQRAAAPALPVTESGTVVGILTQGSVRRLAARLLASRG